ncbi:MAG: CPBP family intramembrane metalloprotease [Oscillospiraceae bacterium]|nr:CPBP family intramembrane metalloprotease [Oscillospiraceae bacterium]
MKDVKLRRYLLWAFVIAWPIQGLASWYALQGKQQLFQIIMAGCMFAPMLAVLLSGIGLKGMGWGLDLKGKWGWVLAAWLVPIGLSVLGALLYFLLFPGRADFNGELYKAQLVATVGEEGAAQAIAELEAKGVSLQMLSLISIVQAVTYAPLINTFFSLGEEVGWRGAMLPRLKARFGRRGGWLLGGLIWGAWHWPVMILAGYEYGLVYWGAPALGMAAFCLFTTAVGLLLDLCYEKTRCIWVPSLGHGAVNAAGGVPLLFLDPAYADQMILGPGMIGLVAGIPLLLLGLFVLLRAKNDAPAPDETAAA